MAGKLHPKGFALIEIMIVVMILAILSVGGTTLYRRSSSPYVPQSPQDALRIKEDAKKSVDAINQVMRDQVKQVEQLEPSTAPVTQTPALGLTVLTPQFHDFVVSPIHIAGSVNGSGWGGFEGQVGTVTLVDAAGIQLGFAVLQATTPWTELPTSFEARVEYASSKTATGTLIFHNENPSDLPRNNREFRLSVRLK